MNKRQFAVLLVLAGIFSRLLLLGSPTSAHPGDDHIGATDVSSSSKYKELQQQIDELTSKLKETRNRGTSLANQIAYMDSQIHLTTLKIEEATQKIAEITEEIAILTKRIGVLEHTLTDISEVLIDRVVATYKSGYTPSGLAILSSNELSEMISRAKYLQLVQTHDKKLLFEIQQTKNDFEEQKSLLEQKKKELDLLSEKLESEQAALNRQKKEKQVLLEVTRNDEKQYQELLTKLRAEQAAIEAALRQALISLKNGTPIEEGKDIALMGNTGSPYCSTGAHLHFEITKDGVRQNPADYLKPIDVVWDNAPDGSFSFGGGWSWPMESPRITQGYGMTYYARTGFYGGSPHTGVDMISNNPIIRAPKKGTLYRGSASCRGAGMNYVAIDHGEGIISWYWHVQ